MTLNVFTYGSLMFPEIWSRVVRGNHRFARATADGYACFSVRDEIYPGLVKRPGSRVEGVVYFDIDATDLAALDAFEGADYQREPIALTLDDGREIAGETYLYLPVARLLATGWAPENFQKQRFVDTYCRDKLGE